MSDNRDLFVRLFAAEKKLVSDMDMVQLRARKEELRLIITEAKIRSAAVDDVEKERTNKLSREKREFLASSDGHRDSTVSDALLVVEKRKKKQSASEKLAAGLLALGLDNHDTDSMVAKAIRKQTGAAVTSSSSRVLIDKPGRTESEDEPKPKRGLIFTGSRPEQAVNTESQTATSEPSVSVTKIAASVPSFADLMKKK